ncbi:N-acetylglucosamine-6-phosphate deacetylase [Pseudoteredinibacter isoporae]|uniref:N-acetylglucosamine-6-phosphate deacetylase n=1 Tax=Pseudoteredinibacter isoporae TaxID=570281 RepID=A0A7X0JQN9_9GAMM|nr:N-acetylglucosamine-6-phosphate deacetylase [Pseudoteredinibacter isoporae]MBB6520019.1 N-acetylglucosamine-6-phosphate deacetylase [Pseudoteredinibacter isoporae]NHO85591.1 N-acetylglucosamine-6-phosphate deacetylase [Pseudoteredinibacter isoporae]NIB25957.1 N-acetylglucosamine-6-phosphate deacetylase [Pseudoteredinibacter isoporae]
MAKNDPIRAILCRQIFDGEQRHHNAALLIAGHKILAIKPQSELSGDEIIVDLGDRLLAPGLIDIQVNGGGDVLFNKQPNLDGLKQIANAHLSLGTSRIMPTIISDEQSIRQQAADAVQQARNEQLSGILGLHLEGPFFARSKRGAHKEEFIRRLESDDAEALKKIAQKLLLMVTLAPEAVPANTLQELAQQNIHVWAGHSNASYEQAVAALEEGVCGFTHLFNAMSSIQARDPGLLGAALEDQHSYCGLIADGHHVHPSNIRLLLRSKSKGKVVLVSDAMATVGGHKNTFDLYEETLSVQGSILINGEGNLAGSAIALIDAIHFLREQDIVSLDEALRMASLYPAQSLGLEHKLGYLKAGYEADFICLENDLQVYASSCAGNIIFKQETKRG